MVFVVVLEVQMASAAGYQCRIKVGPAINVVSKLAQPSMSYQSWPSYQCIKVGPTINVVSKLAQLSMYQSWPSHQCRIKVGPAINVSKLAQPSMSYQSGPSYQSFSVHATYWTLPRCRHFTCRAFETKNFH